MQLGVPEVGCFSGQSVHVNSLQLVKQIDTEYSSRTNATKSTRTV